MNANPRIIAVFTGNRAEYGLQFPILEQIAAHPDLDYRLIVSGAHLDANFGQTLSEIRGDGFDVHAEVKIDMTSDDLAATADAIGSGVIGVSQALRELEPDMLLVYADRFEGFAAVIAGTQSGIPTGHIEGGDLTEGGALDDSVRHAMTKLSHLHFTTNQQASNRILAMGEEAWRVHTVGFPMIDLLNANDFTPEKEVLDRFELDLEKPIVLFTQHSVTSFVSSAVNQLMPSLEALARIARAGGQIIITYPNNDAGGRAIYAELEKFIQTAPTGIQLYQSVGRKNFHGLLALAQNYAARIVCAGNSSSGIKETPALGCPTVNIGTRQKGRLRADNVIDADYDAESIERALLKGLYDPEFRRICRSCSNPYGQGDAGKNIANVVADIPINDQLLVKRMTLKGKSQDGWFK